MDQTGKGKLTYMSQPVSKPDLKMQHTYIYSIYIGKAGGNGNFCGNLGKKKHYKKKVFPYIQHLQMLPFVSFIIVSFLSNELGNYFPHPNCTHVTNNFY